MACPITCPPNTRCQLVFGLRPRNRFTSIGSRSRMEIRSIRPLDIGERSVLTHTSFTRSAQPEERRLRRVSKDARMYHGASAETPRTSGSPQDGDGGGVV